MHVLPIFCIHHERRMCEEAIRGSERNASDITNHARKIHTFNFVSGFFLSFAFLAWEKTVEA